MNTPSLGSTQSDISASPPTQTIHPHTMNTNPIATQPSTCPQADRRFQIIEDTLLKQQEHNVVFHQRISTLELTTNSIDEKMDSVLTALETMAHPSKRRAHSRPESHSFDYDDIMDENLHPASHPLTYDNGCTEKCPP
jgi:hypothetical protein